MSKSNNNQFSVEEPCFDNETNKKSNKKPKLNRKEKIRVLYHFPCPDGAFSALAAYLYYKDESKYDLKFIPSRVEMNAISVKENSDIFDKDCIVYLCDYTGSKTLVRNLSKSCKKIIVLDHHKTGKEMIDELIEKGQLGKNVDNRIVMNKSGATLAWTFFHELNNGKPLIENEKDFKRVEELFQYIEDHDLWNNKLPKTKEFSAGFSSRDYDLDINNDKELWNTLLELNKESLIESGEAQIAGQNLTIDNQLKQSFKIKLGGKKNDFGQCMAVVTTSPELRSEMGNRLAKTSLDAGLLAMAAVAYVEPSLNDHKVYKVSLRSIGDVDTSVISKHFGGGGHANASSFNIGKATFLKWKI